MNTLENAIIVDKRPTKIGLPTRLKAKQETYTISIAKICSAINCSSVKIYARSYCNMHYQRLRIYGNADYVSARDERKIVIDGDTARVPVGVNAKDGYALIDTEDIVLVEGYKWHITSEGYVKTASKRDSTHFMHHLVIGKPDDGYETDHINANPMDNRKSNLRVVTRSQNEHNTGSKLGSFSQYKGVTLVNGSRWKASIRMQGVKTRAKYFSSENEAALQYNIWAKELFGEHARLNIIGEYNA